MEKPARDFKGIWIPKEIWLSEQLSLMEKVLFVEIHSLDNEDGCYASGCWDLHARDEVITDERLNREHSVDNDAIAVDGGRISAVILRSKTAQSAGL